MKINNNTRWQEDQDQLHVRRSERIRNKETTRKSKTSEEKTRPTKNLTKKETTIDPKKRATTAKKDTPKRKEPHNQQKT